MTYDEAVAALGEEVAGQIAAQAKAAPPIDEKRLDYLAELFSGGEQVDEIGVGPSAPEAVA